MDLSIIIVSYNTKELVQSLLSSLDKYLSKALSSEVIIVDNASEDGTKEALSTFSSRNFRIETIYNVENLGFSKANNIGIKYAKGNVLLFLNPDTKFQEVGIEKIVRYLETHPKVGAATARLVLPNGVIDDACHRGFPTPWNAFCHFSGLSKLFPKVKLFTGYSLSWMDFTKMHEIDACAGAFMLVRRTAGEEIGWWDEDFFFYGEDLDFCFRLKEKGWKIIYIPTFTVKHYKGVSGGIKKHSQYLSKADRETRQRVQGARFSAMRIFYKKHYEKKYSPFIRFLVLKGILLRMILANTQVTE